MLDFELKLLEFIQQHRLVELDPILIFITSTTTVASITLAILFSWLISRKYTSGDSKLYLISVFLVLSCSSLLSYVLKLSFSRARPFTLSDQIIDLATVSTHSFPSGHTTAAFSIVFGLIFFYPKWKVVIPVIIWAIIVAYSRLALGVHFLSDILAGVLLSFLVALFLYSRATANKETNQDFKKT